MGYIRHDAVIAMGYPYDVDAFDAMRAEVDALRAEMGDQSGILLGPIPTVVNGDEMYVYLPDGSKEGWDTSDQHDAWRDRFREIAGRMRHWDVLSVRFGGDEPEHIQAEAKTSGSGVVANVNLWV